MITERQLHEIAWYFEESPFGHDIDHMMLARVASQFGGRKERELMPHFEPVVDFTGMTDEEILKHFPGVEGVVHGDH